METTTTTTSTAGKGLGIAALVIGIVTVIWSIIPFLGAAAFWPSLLGLAFGIIGLALAIKGNNAKKGIIIAGFVLCVVSTGVSAYWVSAINTVAEVVNAAAVPVQ